MYKFLEEFAKTDSKSDKLKNHGYQRVYPWFLSHFKEAPINLLEIGIADSESIKLWRNYFENINLFALDILPIEVKDEDIKVFQVDQSKENELVQFALNINIKFDVIIDDGSHVPEHQLLTLKTLWKSLKEAGVYIIEDIETSYWGRSSLYGYKFNSNKVNTLNVLLNVINYINSKFLLGFKREKNSIYHDIFNQVESITFGHNCIILVKKDYDSFSEFYDGDYILKQKINERSIYKSFKARVKKYLNLVITPLFHMQRLLKNRKYIRKN